VDLKGLEGILLSIHVTLAALTGTPEFALEEKEAAEMARALGQVARHYNIPAVAPYIMDHVSLVIVLAAVYGKRYTAVKLRQAASKARPVNEGNVRSWPFGPVVSGTPAS
jgi:hypothetical protein